jgi:hypothetical protein
MIARHSDYERRIVASDDPAFKRIGERNRCGSQKRESDETPGSEHFHISILDRTSISQVKINAG